MRAFNGFLVRCDLLEPISHHDDVHPSTKTLLLRASPIHMVISSVVSLNGLAVSISCIFMVSESGSRDVSPVEILEPEAPVK